MTILQKLNAIQLAIKAPKTQDNDYGKFKYRSCEDILLAVKPLLAEHKLVLILEDNIRYIEGRFYIEATAKLIDCEAESPIGENVIRNTAYARESETKSGMDASQITGTASSYARKYALNGLFCIDDAKDADTNEYVETTQNKGKNRPENQFNKKLTAQHLNILIKACANQQLNTDAENHWKKHFNVEKLEDIPDVYFDEILKTMRCDKYGNYKG